MKKLSFLVAIIAIGSTLYYGIQTAKHTAEAYIFSYPVVLMDATRDEMATPEVSVDYTNFLSHSRKLPTHEFRSVVRPNNDTLYSVAWFDLSEEPQIISVPDMGDTYYVLPFMDAWTNVFATAGTRTTGNNAKQVALVGPHWQGDLDDSFHRVDAPTNMVWMIARVEVEDLENPSQVYELQDQFAVTSLTGWSSNQWRENLINTALPESSGLAPPEKVAAMQAREFFTQVGRLLENQPTQPADQAMMDVLANLGVEAGKSFTPNFFQEWVMNQTLTSVREKLNAAAEGRQPNEINWSVIRSGIGNYGQDYKSRTFVAMFGLGALPPEEASYPNTRLDSSGQALNGQHRYRIRWDRDQLPPVNAFWSLTIYDAEGYMIDNPIQRYRLGSNNDLQWDNNDSLELQLQSTAPDSDHVNWLPVPPGEFNIVLRMYWPDESFLNSKWQMPIIERLP